MVGRSCETIAAHSAAGGHVIDVLLVDGKDPASLWPETMVNEAQFILCQHRAGNREMAASPALAAVALTDAQLSSYVVFPKMNCKKTPEFTDEDTAGVFLSNHSQSFWFPTSSMR